MLADAQESVKDAHTERFPIVYSLNSERQSAAA